MKWAHVDMKRHFFEARLLPEATPDIADGLSDLIILYRFLLTHADN